MKKILSLTLMAVTFAFVAGAFGAATPAAQAAAPTAASGTFATGLPTNVVIRTAGPISFITDTNTNSLSGTFSGNSVLQERTIVRADGSAFSVAVETFTGTVNGISGTATLIDLVNADGASFNGRFFVLSGTGGLANLRGQGTFEGSTVTGEGTYSGQIFSQ